MSDTPQQPGAGRAILQAIADSEKRIMGAMVVLLDEIRRGGAAHAPASGVASDADLDGQYGNPEVKKDPPRWKGESHVGKRYSECTSEYLAEMAGFQTWAAERDEKKAAPLSDGDDKKKAEKDAWYARQRASYARGWAARLRAKPPETPPQDPPADPNW